MNELMYRVCEVNGEECIFHCWEQYSIVVEASALVGGHPAGRISQVFGIVEFKDGTVKRIQPYDVKFVPDELVLKRRRMNGKDN